MRNSLAKVSMNMAPLKWSEKYCRSCRVLAHNTKGEGVHVTGVAIGLEGDGCWGQDSRGDEGVVGALGGEDTQEPGTLAVLQGCRARLRRLYPRQV